MAKKILVYSNLPEEAEQFLLGKGYELVVCDSTDEDELIEAAKDCEASVGPRRFKKKFFENTPKMKAVCLGSAGVDYFDVESATKAGITVTNGGGANALSVAEHAVLLMLGVSRHITYTNRIISGEIPWSQRKSEDNEITGKTISLLGYGNIAAHLGRICKYGFDMKVIAYHPRIAEKQVPQGFVPCDDWEYAFSQADYVSSHIPMRPENERIIGEREFGLMKKESYFINTGRGRVVDEAALIKALQTGSIAGAGLDVFAKEPPDADNPLLSMDNVVCTPHSAVFTIESRRRTMLVSAQEADRILSGKKPLYNVN